MKPAGGFVKRTSSDAVGAIRAVCLPEGKTGLGIDRPSEQALPVGYIIGFFRRLSIPNRLAGAFFGYGKRGKADKFWLD